MQINTVRKPTVFTHEGAPAKTLHSEEQLRRSVMACMLWEDTFYENGQDIGARITELVPKVSPEFAAACAYYARTQMHLRHVPLLIVRIMAQTSSHKHLVGSLLRDVIQRPDELMEFVAIYWKDGKVPLSNQVRKGLAKAFLKFNEYQFAKYDNQRRSVKLCDVMALVRPKPQTEEQAALFKRIASNTMKTPDTWETALSGGADKKETFERLMAENKLGAMAFLRNLRNMAQVGISKSVVADYASRVSADRVLPFRFVAAAKHAPQYEDAIEPLMLNCLRKFDQLKGRTVLVIDNSGSMYSSVSTKSQLNRADAAAALGTMIREICVESEIIVFGSTAAVIPSRRGFALIDAIKNGPGGGTNTAAAIELANRYAYDRLILITDEQSHTRYPDPKAPLAYCINVASYKHGIGYGPKWFHIDGWSENILSYITEREETESADE